MIKKLVFIFHVLSCNIFCAEISFFEFITEEFCGQNDAVNAAVFGIHDFVLVNQENHLKQMPEKQVIDTYKFNYFLCVNLIDFFIKKEKKLRLRNNELNFLKETEIIGTVKDYLINSINQEMDTLTNQLKTLNGKDLSVAYDRVKQLCVLVNRLSNRLLDVIFDLDNGCKPVRAITIDEIWGMYSRACLMIKNKEKKYAKICKKNNDIIAVTNQINHNDPSSHQEIIDLIKWLIKSMRKLSEYQNRS